MCTLVIAHDPDARWPVLLASTRDEFRNRPWDPPGEWWSESHPGLIGGRDRQAGGTWLVVDPRAGRVAVVLNRIEPTSLADQEAHSRGDLPLVVAADGVEAMAGRDLSLTRPFNLVLAEAGQVTWWRYDGVELSRHQVSPGLHLLTAADLDDMSNPRQRYWLPEFEATTVPSPEREDIAPEGWGGWPALLADVDRPYDDPRALNVRRGGDEGIFGTVSASLLAIDPENLKYEFCPGPPDRADWQRVL